MAVDRDRLQSPPDDVLDALDRAARVIAELERTGVVLALDHDRDSGRVRITMSRPRDNVESALSGPRFLGLLDGDPEFG